MSYDFTAATEYLEREAGISPSALLEEVCAAIRMLHPRLRSGACPWEAYATLVLCGELIRRIKPETA